MKADRLSWNEIETSQLTSLSMIRTLAFSWFKAQKNIFSLFQSLLGLRAPGLGNEFVLCTSAEINIIPMPITMNRIMKKLPVKLNFWRSQ